MRLTDDRDARAVVIWRDGLLDRLPAEVIHGIAACARDGEGWALLLDDFSGHLLAAHEQRLTEEQNATVLDAMAALHQTFWDEPPATIERYSLCPLRTCYEGLFPKALEREADTDLPIVGYAREGWRLIDELVEPDVATLLHALHADVTPLCTALARYPHTLAHGDWHHGNLGIVPTPRPRVILLDWAFVTCGPPAIDLAHYLAIGVMRLPSSKEATIELYRSMLARRLGDRFDEAWWVPQLELALLGEFLRLGFDKAQTAVHGTTEAIRERERREIAWWCKHMRRATRWL
jgi:hypothetical protein